MLRILPSLFALASVAHANVNGTAEVSGTLQAAAWKDMATMSDVKTGGDTVIVTLKDALFDATIGDGGQATVDLIDGFHAFGAAPQAVAKSFRDGLNGTTDVVRTSGTVVTINLPANPAFAMTADTAFYVEIPASATDEDFDIMAMGAGLDCKSECKEVADGAWCELTGRASGTIGLHGTPPGGGENVEWAWCSAFTILLADYVPTAAPTPTPTPAPSADNSKDGGSMKCTTVVPDSERGYLLTADITSGGSKISVVLTGAKFDASVGSTTDGTTAQEHADFVNGFASSAGEASKWVTLVNPAINYTDIKRIDDSTVHITLPAVADYTVPIETGSETISFAAPASATDHAVEIGGCTFDVNADTPVPTAVPTVAPEPETPAPTPAPVPDTDCSVEKSEGDCSTKCGEGTMPYTWTTTTAQSGNGAACPPMPESAPCSSNDGCGFTLKASMGLAMSKDAWAENEEANVAAFAKGVSATLGVDASQVFNVAAKAARRSLLSGSITVTYEVAVEDQAALDDAQDAYVAAVESGAFESAIQDAAKDAGLDTLASAEATPAPASELVAEDSSGKGVELEIPEEEDDGEGEGEGSDTTSPAAQAVASFAAIAAVAALVQ